MTFTTETRRVHVDIKFSAHGAFLNNPFKARSKSKYWKAK